MKLRAGVDELEYLSVLFYDNPALGLMGDTPVRAHSENVAPRAVDGQRGPAVGKP